MRPVCRRRRQQQQGSSAVGMVAGDDVFIGGGGECYGRAVPSYSARRPSPTLPQRWARRGAPGVERRISHRSTSTDGPVAGDEAAAVIANRGRETAKRLTVWSSRERPAMGGNSRTSLNPLPLAACSLALLVLFVDPAAAFQPVVPQAPQRAVGDPRKQQGWARAHTCLEESSSGVLLQGSFTGRLSRQARKVPFVWGIRWPSLPAKTALEATNSAGGGGIGGGVGVGSSNGGGAGLRGRGSGGGTTGRRPSENPVGAREAHAYASPSLASAREQLSQKLTTVGMFPEIMEGLSCFNRVHGHVKVPKAFVVPPTQAWPEDMWNFELGKSVNKMREEKETYERQYPDRAELLKSIGFEWEQHGAEDEWDLIKIGIEGFFDVNGHSRVPTRFIVPAETPWPIEVWGYKLGTRVAQMRNSGRHMGENEETMEERRNDLDKLGFEWRLRVFDDSVEGDGTPEEFSILCEGLQVYQDLGGSVPNMPPSFVIPNADPWPIRTRGFPLGSEVRVVRSRQKYAKDSKEKAEELVALGVPISVGKALSFTGQTGNRRSGGPAETRFEKVCIGLEAYITLAGTPDVPPDFEVPRKQPWPAYAWGCKLGTSLANIVNKGTFVKNHPERTARLEAMGFDTDPGGLRAFRDRVDSGMSATDAIAATQAALDFEEEDATRHRDPAVIKHIRATDAMRKQDHREKVAKESELRESIAGVTPQWSDSEDREKPSWEKEDEEHDNQMAPFLRAIYSDQELASFTDQTDLTYWPDEKHHENARKLIPKLGHLARGFDDVAVITGALGTKHMELPGVILPLEFDPKRKQKRVLESFEERDEEEEEDEEEEYLDENFESPDGIGDRQRGRRLPKGFSTTGSGLHWATDELRDRIMKVGFEWEEFSAGFKWRDVEAGLRHYCTLYGELPGDDFAVPTEDYEWPPQLLGMQLGSYCKQMRIGDIWAKYHPSRKKFLDSLGFDWGDDELYLYWQWPEVLTSFYAVMRLKGHLEVRPEFVIPHQDPWPLPLHGVPVGYYLNIIKSQQDMLMEHYPERFQILRGLGVIWDGAIIVDWENEEEHDLRPWRRWGFNGVQEEPDIIAVDPELGLKPDALL